MSLRDEARISLTNFTDSRPDQVRLRKRFLDHLDEHEDALEKGCRPGHVTASGLIIDPIKQRVLLTLHPKVGRWLQTGGHCEAEDAGVAQAALREAHEESGITGLILLHDLPIRLDAHVIDCRKDGGTIHYDVQYAVLAPANAVTIMSEESDDLAWFPVTELPSNSDIALRNLVNDSISVMASREA
ncbi:MAG TPA: NUDIX domain-containing protein [Candidatus Nanopelagicaceae bacterium]|nr:NUDIX domain-containing protein [Candidatus Nanopelagicaceae bacterium]